MCFLTSLSHVLNVSESRVFCFCFFNRKMRLPLVEVCKPLEGGCDCGRSEALGIHHLLIIAPPANGFL